MKLMYDNVVTIHFVDGSKHEFKGMYTDDFPDWELGEMPLYCEDTEELLDVVVLDGVLSVQITARLGGVKCFIDNPYYNVYTDSNIMTVKQWQSRKESKVDQYGVGEMPNYSYFKLKDLYSLFGGNKELALQKFNEKMKITRMFNLCESDLEDTGIGFIEDFLELDIIKNRMNKVFFDNEKFVSSDGGGYIQLNKHWLKLFMEV